MPMMIRARAISQNDGKETLTDSKARPMVIRTMPDEARIAGLIRSEREPVKGERRAIRTGCSRRISPVSRALRPVMRCR